MCFTYQIILIYTSLLYMFTSETLRFEKTVEHQLSGTVLQIQLREIYI